MQDKNHVYNDQPDKVLNNRRMLHETVNLYMAINKQIHSIVIHLYIKMSWNTIYTHEYTLLC